MEYKGQKIKNERPAFWETILLLTLKGKILYKFSPRHNRTEHSPTSASSGQSRYPENRVKGNFLP
jgi:hypothetical protein